MNQKLRNYPFWVLCTLFCAGIFCSSLSDFFLPISIISCFLFIPFFAYFFRKKSDTLFLIVTGILFLILGVIRHQIANPKHNTNHLINIVQTKHPKKLTVSIKEVFKESQKTRNYKVRLHSCDDKKINGYALLSIQKSDTISKFKLGDTFITYSILMPLKQLKNPYTFEYADYLKNMGITHKIWATSQQLHKIESLVHPWNKFFNSIRNLIEINLQKQALAPDVLQITEALVLGNKSSLNQKLKTSFANAGVIHILAISGLHIGILYFILSGLFNLIFPYSKNNIVITLGIVALLWLFTSFSGSSPSALRATTMFTCFQIAKSILRQQHPINALFLSVFILVLVNPNIISSVGFQLSITAVGGIIIGVPKMLAFWYPKHWFVNKVWSIICMSFCAQIGILPLSIYYFHQFSGLFLLANIPVMLVIVFLLSAAILVVFVSCFYQIPNLLINLYNEFTLTLINYINWVSQLEVFIIKKLYITSITLVFTYVLYAYIIYTYKNPRKGFEWSLPILTFILLIGFWEFNQRLFKNELWILNNYNNTIITELTSEKIKIHSKKKLTNNETNYMLEPLIGNLHYSKVNISTLQNSYKYQGRNIHVITSKNQLPNIEAKGIFILDESPKVNIERLLKTHQPELIIASALNYSNLIEKWKATCSKEQVAFYSISENGALNLH